VVESGIQERWHEDHCRDQGSLFVGKKSVSLLVEIEFPYFVVVE
jgi:hypothetical protein